GRAKMMISNEEGGEVIISMLGPGELFGERELLDDIPSSASVKALEKCRLMRISKVVFLRCFLEDRHAAMCLIRVLTRRLREADRQIESLALMDVPGRVTRLLLDLAVNIDGKHVIRKAPQKQEIAHMIGASREMVTRVIREMKNSGHVSIDGRRVVLLANGLERRRQRAIKLVAPVMSPTLSMPGNMTTAAALDADALVAGVSPSTT